MFSILNNELTIVASYMAPAEQYIYNIIAPHSMFIDQSDVYDAISYAIKQNWKDGFRILPTARCTDDYVQLALNYDCDWYIKTMLMGSHYMLDAIKNSSYRCISYMHRTLFDPKSWIREIAQFGDPEICEIFGDIFNRKELCTSAIQFDNLSITLYAQDTYLVDDIIILAYLANSVHVLAHYVGQKDYYKLMTHASVDDDKTDMVNMLIVDGMDINAIALQGIHDVKLVRFCMEHGARNFAPLNEQSMKTRSQLGGWIANFFI